MRKLLDVLTVVSFLGTAGIIGAGAYVYIQKDALIEGVKKEVVNAAITGVAGALPGLLDNAMPQIPSQTGPEMPTTGVPSF